jgi:hypothetical protein
MLQTGVTATQCVLSVATAGCTVGQKASLHRPDTSCQTCSSWFVARAMLSIVRTGWLLEGVIGTLTVRWPTLLGCAESGLDWFVVTVGLSATLLVACTVCICRLLLVLPLLLLGRAGCARHLT